MGKRARDPRTWTQSSRLRLWTRRLGHAYRRVRDSGWPSHVRTISASKKWSSSARNVRTTCVLGIRRSYIHQLAHASNPVPNTASRRALSVRILTEVLRLRGHFLERVVHCIGDGTRVRRYERVNLRVVSALSSRDGGGKGGTHGRRLRVRCPRPSPRAHRAEHGACDLHRTVLRRRAHLHLVWPRCYSANEDWCTLP